MQFSEEIEEFVSEESMRDWWNRRKFLEISLRTYCFFVQCNIPRCVGLLQATKWRLNIHKMLRRIPDVQNRTFIPRDIHCDLSCDNYGDDKYPLDDYFEYIDSKLVDL